MLKNEDVFNNLIELANFWNDVENQNSEKFSKDVLRKLFVLYYAPNGMWTYFTSVYFMKNKDNDGLLNQEAFNDFLGKSIGFIWASAIMNPGVNSLRGPIYNEMINIVNDNPITFENYKYKREELEKVFNDYIFNNQRPITRSMLTWWAFMNPEQKLLNTEIKFDIEHIFPKNRQNKLVNFKNLESLGNKSLLEKKINIRASDYRFKDKTNYYKGDPNNPKQKKAGTDIEELKKLSNNLDDFVEAHIEERKEKITNTFLDYLESYKLFK